MLTWALVTWFRNATEVKDAGCVMLFAIAGDVLIVGLVAVMVAGWPW